MRYQMIGIDLDGTLLDEDGQVSDENRAAIARAQEAGVLVVPCTGRAWNEAHQVIDGIPGIDIGVFVTGSVVNDMHTGRALHTDGIDPTRALHLVNELYDLPDAVLVFRERGGAGCDYLVTGRGKLSDNTRWWFEMTESQVVCKPQVTEEDLSHTLRVGMVSHADDIQDTYQRIAARCEGLYSGHCFPGIVRNELGECVYIIEMFAPGVNKWTGLQWIAARHGIDESAVAVMGDQINDVPMFAAAGCGIAMGNAAEFARRHARYVSTPNHEHGVAHAIDQLLNGDWQ